MPDSAGGGADGAAAGARTEGVGAAAVERESSERDGGGGGGTCTAADAGVPGAVLMGAPSGLSDGFAAGADGVVGGSPEPAAVLLVVTALLALSMTGSARPHSRHH